MADDELDIDLDQLDQGIEKKNRVEKRITDLSEKVESTAKERDEATAARTAEEGKRIEAEKERDFYAGFSDMVSTNPFAKDHKDEILAKVKGGYSVEDATYAVLGKAGKLGQPAPAQRENPAGGSATTNPSSGGAKSIADMNQAERRAALVEAEQRGDLGLN